MTNVRKYTAEELTRAIYNLPSFTHWQKDKFIVGVRSNENADNVYDDLFCEVQYVTKATQNGIVSKLEIVTDWFTGTTNSGSYGFANYLKWNKDGVGMIKSNEIYYDVWQVGLHKQKMKALVQVGGFKIIRKKSRTDNNAVWNLEFNKGFNFHLNSYLTGSKLFSLIKKWTIGGWSVGCQVPNDAEKYYDVMNDKKDKQKVTYALLEEF